MTGVLILLPVGASRRMRDGQSKVGLVTTIASTASFRAPRAAAPMTPADVAAAEQVSVHSFPFIAASACVRASSARLPASASTRVASTSDN